MILVTQAFLWLVLCSLYAGSGRLASQIDCRGTGACIAVLAYIIKPGVVFGIDDNGDIYLKRSNIERAIEHIITESRTDERLYSQLC